MSAADVDTIEGFVHLPYVGPGRFEFKDAAGQIVAIALADTDEAEIRHATCRPIGSISVRAIMPVRLVEKRIRIYVDSPRHPGLAPRLGAPVRRRVLRARTIYLDLVGDGATVDDLIAFIEDAHKGWARVPEPGPYERGAEASLGKLLAHIREGQAKGFASRKPDDG